VSDQAKALSSYTDVLGFRKKHDFPMGEYRWITVVSPEAPADVELTLETNAHPVAKTFQEAMFSDGIPLAAFEVSDIAREYERLRKQGVAFTKEPTPAGPVTLAIFADGCGNLIPDVPDGVSGARRRLKKDRRAPRGSPAGRTRRRDGN
jgi:glyoxylase I family protein